ncbi:MAG: hypothetical protein WKF84_29805 [Pyrinomonadaceae bacterium]
MAVTLLICSGWPVVAAGVRQGLSRRHLIICVDGVGYSLIAKMRTEGRFRYFAEPARMISPFPTLTNVSMTQVMMSVGAQDAAGYEDSYYDQNSNRIRGGIVDRFRGGSFINGTFREFFDYHPSALKSGFGYAAPPVSTYVEALSDLMRLRQKFKSSRDENFYAYLGATDSLAHLGGEAMLRSYLKRVDNFLSDVVREHGDQLEITIFSDHGNHFTNYQRVHLKEAVRKAGFKIEKSIRNPQSIVLPQFGLIGCALFFTAAGQEERLAEVVAPLRGVSFAAYLRHQQVVVVGRSSGGKAFIERRADRFRYAAIDGDPLRLLEIVRSLKQAGKADAEDFIDDADWFAALAASDQPDAVRRVYDALRQSVKNRASVVVSFDDGFYSGSSSLDIFAFLQATHGSLGREQTTGFVINSTRSLPQPSERPIYGPLSALRVCERQPCR